MDIVSLIIIAVIGVFMVFEGKEAFKGMIEMRKATEHIKQNKKDVQICKDYMLMVTVYAVFAVCIIGYGIYFITVQNNYMYGLMFIVLSLFCIVFIVESISIRTIVFYESGFLYGGRTFKYRSVLKIEEKKSFLKGYRVKLTSEDEVYVSKKTKPVMEERLKAFKNRKKVQHER